MLVTFIAICGLVSASKVFFCYRRDLDIGIVMPGIQVMEMLDPNSILLCRCVIQILTKQ